MPTTVSLSFHTAGKHLHETDPRWFAIHTRSKSEKLVQRQLLKKGIHAYVPLQRLMRRYVRSTRMVEIPLINCYVFVRIVQREYLPVLETEHVAGFVKFDRRLVAIPSREMETLRRITLEDGLQLSAIPGALTAGDPVEIIAGNLAGLRGKIVRSDGKNCFQVELERLGYSLLITVDAAFLQKSILK